MKYLKKEKGFTLAELLIVVAIIGVLVAISIPIFSTQLHKARVATDWANLRAYYAEIQADYISTGEQNPKVPDIWGTDPYTGDWYSVTFLDGHKVSMKAGICSIGFKKESGYSIIYDCKNYDEKCHLVLGK